MYYCAPPQDRFFKALSIVYEEFLDHFNYISSAWYPARELTKKAILQRFEFDKSGEIIMLETLIPWKDHLIELEAEMNIVGVIKFVLFEGNISLGCVTRDVIWQPVDDGVYEKNNFKKRKMRRKFKHVSRYGRSDSTRFISTSYSTVRKLEGFK